MFIRTVGAAIAGFALVSAPISAAIASVRPGSAVPAAASANTVSSSAQYGNVNAWTPWPAYAVIALTLAMGVWIATQDGDGDAISRG